MILTDELIRRLSSDTLKRINEDLNAAWANNMLLNEELCQSMCKIKAVIDERRKENDTGTA
jgi:hypothetical protein